MSRIERITKSIQNKYPHAVVNIKDETKYHIGHKEILDIQNPQETHLNITVYDTAFEDASPISSIREINRLIKDEFAQGLHAVKIACEGAPKE
ncbi:hypothetical protein NEMIN01_0894 [Nematocida minor]|uniref:uncharacterized protein n=1 Tax=Nematocida minor TaxID=1912983 RepID=UPI00221ECD20|nr:uncharacterized protein NEMIN01_0894 [Nematocida minor]KAI5190195.1 hypothetical protein NEMIN01_0894 [Nematocida minor]